MGFSGQEVQEWANIDDIHGHFHLPYNATAAGLWIDYLNNSWDGKLTLNTWTHPRRIHLSAKAMLTQRQTVNTTQVQLLITEELLTTMSEWVSEVAQSCPTLCDPMDCSLPGSSLHGILQARILEWAAISFSRGSSWLGDRTWVPCIAGRCFNLWATREAQDNNSVLPLLQNLPPE